MQEVEIINIEENEVVATETIPTQPVPETKHCSLVGRNNDNQHSINAITGLADELAKITTPRTIESDKVGVANYYMWSDKNPNEDNRVGYFVTCCVDDGGQVVIKIFNEEEDKDVFGVTVDEAAFIGGQDATIQRDSRYGLVVTNGFVEVRRDDTVKVGCNVTPGFGGIATKGDDNYGNRVVAFSTNEGIDYAKIYLGMSPKQASDIAGDMVALEGNIGSINKEIKRLDTVINSFDPQAFGVINITDGKIAGWDAKEDRLEKTFETDAKSQHKAILSSSDTEPYVFGIKEITEGQEDWKFGVAKNGEVYFSDVQNTNIGDWNIEEDGLKITHTQNNVCSVCGEWSWNKTISYSKNIEQDVQITAGDATDVYVGITYNVNDNRISYLSKDGPVTSTGSYPSVNIDFGVHPQYVSLDFCEFLEANATPSNAKAKTEKTEIANCSAILNSDITDVGDNIFEVKNNDVTKFYVNLNGDGYISNAENADNANKFANKPISDFMGHGTNFDYGIVNGNNTRTLNDIKYEYHNFIVNFKNAPSADGGWGFLDVFVGAGTGFLPSTTYSNGCRVIIQKFTGYSTGQEFTRTMKQSRKDDAWVDGTWSSWKSVTVTDNIADTYATKSALTSGSLVPKKALTLTADGAGNCLIDGAPLSYHRANFQAGVESWDVVDIRQDQGSFLDFKKNNGSRIGGIAKNSSSNDILTMEGDWLVTGQLGISNGGDFLVGGDCIFEPTSDVYFQGKTTSTTDWSVISGTWKFGKDAKIINSTNQAQVTSDKNYKHDIQDMPVAYETLFDSLRPVIYKYNEGTSDRYHTGFISQEVDEAITASGLTRQDFAAMCINDQGTEDELWTLRYDEFISLNTHEIQKLKARVKELEEKNAKLEERLDKIEALLNAND